MDDNFGDTPNPLNPNYSAKTEFASESNSTPTSEPIHHAPVAKAPAPATPTMEAATPATHTPDPMARPMVAAPVADTKPVKKKKTGLIAGAIICLLIAIGCIVAAVLIILNQNNDPVSKAIEKLLNGNVPASVSLDGTITSDMTKDDDSPFSNLSIAIKTDLTTKPITHSTNATITLTVKESGEKIELETSGIYTMDGDLYLKVDGSTSAIDSQTEETSSFYFDLLEGIDGEWLRISGEEIGTLMNSTEDSTYLTCATDLLTGISNNRDRLIDAYQNNPFIASTTSDLSVISVRNPIYKIILDQEKLTGFLDSTTSSSEFTDFLSCLGFQNSVVDTSKLIELVKDSPELYVEIDQNYNLTRIYFVTELENSNTEATVDLRISYPANVNILEPVEYTDLSALMQEIFTSDF